MIINIDQNIVGIILGVVSSLIASIVFWLLTFKFVRTQVKFSEKIEKSKNTGEYQGKNRYRVKFINVGNNDLTEIQFIVRLSIKRKTVTNHTFLGIGNDNKLPVLRGKNFQCKKKTPKSSFILTLYPTDTTLREFQKSIYPENIRKKAEDGILSLDEIFEEFDNNINIIIYAYGNDLVTGARRMHVSKKFCIDDIKMGEYKKAGIPKRIGYKKYVCDLLTLIDKDPEYVTHEECEKLRSMADDNCNTTP